MINITMSKSIVMLTGELLIMLVIFVLGVIALIGVIKDIISCVSDNDSGAIILLIALVTCLAIATITALIRILIITGVVNITLVSRVVGDVLCVV